MKWKKKLYQGYGVDHTREREQLGENHERNRNMRPIEKENSTGDNGKKKRNIS